MTDLAGDSDRGPWRRTTRWRPSRGPGRGGDGGGPVEHPVTGEYGYCKIATPRASPAREWIASALAREVGVHVPECRIGRLEGHEGLVSVSVAWGAESVDLDTLRARGQYDAATVQAAIRAASGLLPFHAWLLVDGGDRHLMAAPAGGGLVLTAIDFTGALRDTGPLHPERMPTSATALRLGVDPAVVAATVARIEACSDARIAAIVHTLPLEVLSWSPQAHPPEQEGWWRHWYIRGLQWRRPAVRGAMERAGFCASSGDLVKGARQENYGVDA